MTIYHDPTIFGTHRVEFDEYEQDILNEENHTLRQYEENMAKWDYLNQDRCKKEWYYALFFNFKESGIEEDFKFLMASIVKNFISNVIIDEYRNLCLYKNTDFWYDKIDLEKENSEIQTNNSIELVFNYKPNYGGSGGGGSNTTSSSSKKPNNDEHEMRQKIETNEDEANDDFNDDYGKKIYNIFFKLKNNMMNDEEDEENDNEEEEENEGDEEYENDSETYREKFENNQFVNIFNKNVGKMKPNISTPSNIKFFEDEIRGGESSKRNKKKLIENEINKERYIMSTLDILCGFFFNENEELRKKSLNFRNILNNNDKKTFTNERKSKRDDNDNNDKHYDDNHLGDDGSNDNDEPEQRSGNFKIKEEMIFGEYIYTFAIFCTLCIMTLFNDVEKEIDSLIEKDINQKSVSKEEKEKINQRVQSLKKFCKSNIKNLFEKPFNQHNSLYIILDFVTASILSYEQIMMI